jgi:hypothetical protein
VGATHATHRFSDADGPTKYDNIQVRRLGIREQYSLSAQQKIRVSAAAVIATRFKISKFAEFYKVSIFEISSPETYESRRGRGAGRRGTDRGGLLRGRP